MYATTLGVKYGSFKFPSRAPIAIAQAYISTSLPTALHPFRMWALALNKGHRFRVFQKEVRRAKLEVNNQK
jgi:hypothetical protein